MADNEPFIRLGDDGESAPQLRYSVPESINYAGTSIVSVSLDPGLLNEATRTRLEKNRARKKEKSAAMPLNNLPLRIESAVQRSDNVVSVTTSREINQAFATAPSSFILVPRAGLFGFGSFELVVPEPQEEKDIRPKILFLERVQISTFLGNYGAGRVIKTFSLFPGEKTTMSIRTFKKTRTFVSGSVTESVNVGSSILDSVTEEAAVDFENSIESENSFKFEESESDILDSMRVYSKQETQKSGSAKALLGVAEAKGSNNSLSESDVSTAGEWGTRSAREQNAKTVASALAKHSARSSSKRDVEIDTSSESTSESTVEATTEEGKRETIKRTIENVNASRTLNLVFRQMIQEYISISHLTDIELALYDETSGPYATFPIRELDRFLDKYFSDEPSVRQNLKNSIIREIFYIFDYLDRPVKFLEKVSLDFPVQNIDELDGLSLPERVEYLRVRRDMRSSPPDREFIKVPGVILSESLLTMRTEGVVVDAFLGQGEALDAYSQGLQSETVRQLNLKNNEKEEEIAKIGLGRTIIMTNDSERALLYAQVFPPVESSEEDGGDDD